MQIASKLAGFSLGEADLLRRAVSKNRDILDRNVSISSKDVCKMVMMRRLLKNL